MRELLTSAQMRAIEQEAMESGAVTGLQLMERAGQGVVDAIFEAWPELSHARGPDDAPQRDSTPNETERQAVVLCGPGNNGGDGFVIARLLRELGWDVAVYFLGQAENLPKDARHNYKRWSEIGEVHSLSEGRIAVEGTEGAPIDVVVDALFGTGLARGLSGLDSVQACLANWATGDTGPRVVAVDIVSGICADSGRYLGDPPANRRGAAELTVSFHAAKLGHVLSDGALASGRVVVADIGLAHQPDSALVQAVDQVDRRIFKNGAGHKFSSGHALVMTGGFGATGAARLAARGALRIGAGLVTLAAPAEAMAECAAQVTSVMLKVVPDEDAFCDMLADDRISALCLGPGLGLARAQGMLPIGLAAARPTVLDADALSAFRDAPDRLIAMLHGACVLTPHGGEFARLFPDLATRLATPAQTGPAFSKVEATRDAAKRAGCVVVFKGLDTVIAAPDGACRVHTATAERDAPWLATAGAGDVLAGMIAGLLARGFEPFAAATTAVWLHVEAARAFGPGLIAEDLPEQLPKVLRSLGETG